MRAVVWPSGGWERAWKFLAVSSCVLALGAARAAIPTGHGVQAGVLKVEQIHSDPASNTASITLEYGIGTFASAAGNRGDYNVKSLPGIQAAQDEFLGVLISSVAENGRDNFGTNEFAVSGVERNGSGTYRIVSFIRPGAEYNVNVAGAWFPYDRYWGGLARNATDVNGGPNNVLTGSPGLVLGVHFKDQGSGVSLVDLRGLGIDSRTDGVLLVNHAKDENNYALSRANLDGTWTLFVRDIDQATYSKNEQDPVAFVFIPRTNDTLISGRFNGDGSIAMHSGASALFTVANLGEGRWDLRIPGYGPTNGVLIISAEGGGNLNGDNLVSYQARADGSGWEVQSRDTPGMALQTPVGPGGAPEAAVSFVFVPQLTPGIRVAPASGLVTTATGGAATFEVALEAPPTSMVAINLAPNDFTKGKVTPASLTFGPQDWHAPKKVTVTGQPGAGYGPYQVVLGMALSSDLRYRGIVPQPVAVLSLPARAAMISPADHAKISSSSPQLQVLVTNVVPGNLTVKFFGREAPTVFPGADFTLAVLPDTQMYTAERGGGKKEMFIAQTEWAIANRLSRSIPYVTQLGDISNNGDTPAYFSQWLNATNAMYRLEDPVKTQLRQGMAYGVAVGNHEFTPISDASGSSSNYNRFFGVSRYLGREYYGGHYGTNNNNHFDFFSAGGLDFVALYFEYNAAPPAAVLDWGSEVLRTNAHRRAIVITHNMGNTQTPVTWSAQARAIYESLKQHTNLFMMLGGHVTGQGRREDVYQGRVVRTFVQDYQGWDKGGNGFMRLFEFSPSNNVVVAQCYSPVAGEYLTDENSEFFFEYDMRPTGPGAPAPFTALGTNENVAPGQPLSCPWPELDRTKAYEWYVTVTDSSGQTVASPVSRFTISTNVAPVAANLSRTVPGDVSSELELSATDANGDPLTFEMRTLPGQGWIHRFDPATGAFTYTPAYGFRGSDRFTFAAADAEASSGVATMNLIVAPPPDSNTNGLPDWWEAAYGVSDPDEDADGDGRSNLEEYWANTNPTNAASGLRIIAASRNTNGVFQLSWPSEGSTRYRVQYSDEGSLGRFTDIVRDLASELDTNRPGISSMQTFTDDGALTRPATNDFRYYRIKVIR